jgi:hypothetical protein
MTPIAVTLIVLSILGCIFTARVLWAHDAVLDRAIPESLLSGTKHGGEHGPERAGVADRRDRVSPLQNGDDLLR